MGTVASLEEHLAKCEFTLLPCPKQCKYTFGQVKCFMRKDLNKHLKEDCPNRDYTCEYCGEKGTYAHITQVHDTACKPLCPNDKCLKRMQRHKIKKHLKTECEYTMIPCKYKRLGCKTELERKDIAAHEEHDKHHLHMAIDTIAKLKRKKITLKTKGSITFRVTDCHKKINSSPFYTRTGGYHMKILGELNDKTMSVYACLLKGENDDKLSWPFVGEVTITLLNQLEDKNHFSKTLNVTVEQPVGGNGNCCGFIEFIPHSELGYNQEKNTQYLKDDTLYFRISVKVASHKPWLECGVE